MPGSSVLVEEQGGYNWLDSEPRTLAAKEYRPSYGSDGGYFSMPNRETLFEAVYDLMQEAKPGEFPIFIGGDGGSEGEKAALFATRPPVSETRGALFCDRRYDTVFVYHNGAQSYYAARGFRGSLRV